MATLTLTGTDLAAARAVATWAVLDAAGSHLVDDPTPELPGVLADREQLRRALGHDYEPAATLTPGVAEQLAHLAAECAAEARDLLADGAGQHGPAYDGHYLAQLGRAHRAALALT